MSEMWNLYPAFTGTPVAADTLLMLDTTATPPTAGQVKQVPLSKFEVLLTPTGDITGAADVTAINNVIANGGACVLAWTGTDWTGGQTPFYIGSPLLPATGSSLRGAAPWMASEADFYGAGAGTSGGTVLVTPGTFAGAAVVDLVNTTGTQAFGVTLADFSIEGASAQPVGHGIRVHGAWGACIFEGVCVNGPFADCLHFEADATTGFGPDDFRVSGCKFSGSFTGYGVWADNLPDSWFTDCECSGNALDGWRLGFSLNTRLVAGCKGENNGQAGLHLAGQGGAGRALQVSDFTTHQNGQDGILADNSASGSAGGVYLLSNVVCIDDGTAGGTTFAGIRASGSVNKIQGSNCLSVGAPNGASQTSSSNGMDFDHSSFSGTTANLHDDGSNTAQLVSRESPDGQRVTLQTAFNSATGTTVQNVTGMAVTLPVGTWEVTAWIPVSPHGTTGSTQLIAWTFGGTATSATVAWVFQGGTFAAPVIGTSVTTGLTTPTMTSAGVLVEFRGRVVVTAAGTLQLTVKSGTSGDECTIPVGARIDVQPSL